MWLESRVELAGAFVVERTYPDVIHVAMVEAARWNLNRYASTSVVLWNVGVGHRGGQWQERKRKE